VYSIKSQIRIIVFNLQKSDTKSTLVESYRKNKIALLLISTNLSQNLDEFHSYKELSGHFIKIFSINSKSFVTSS
jgi:hypothetical protein